MNFEDFFEKFLYWLNLQINPQEKEDILISCIYYINEYEFIKTIRCFFEKNIENDIKINFYIRHSITLVALYFMIQKKEELYQYWIKDLYLNHFIEDKIKKTINFNNFKNIRLGFTAKGIHYRIISEKKCQFFDPYSKEICQEECQNGFFCTKHQEEIWWEQEWPHGSMIAINFWHHRFLHLEHKVSLEKIYVLWQKFWKDFKEISFKEQDYLLFGYQSSQELFSCGPAELQKRYHQLALIHHPDRGGDASYFHQISSTYKNILKIFQIS